MTQIEAIQAEIASLSSEDFARLREWIAERDWQNWDRQIERDSAAGKLDFLREEAQAANEQGELRELQAHRTTPQFWKRFDTLPKEVQQLARKNFQLLKQDSRHPSLQFKQLGNHWSARVGLNYRACREGRFRLCVGVDRRPWGV